MQDIPRNELLDKLAAGWKVRRKSWAESAFLQKDAGLKQDVYILELLTSDWEGEPAGPKRIYSDASIEFAFQRLKYDEVLFVRRKEWPPELRAYKNGERFGVNTCDILATDWEVWTK